MGSLLFCITYYPLCSFTGYANLLLQANQTKDVRFFGKYILFVHVQLFNRAVFEKM